MALEKATGSHGEGIMDEAAVNQLIDEHLKAEATGDIPAILATLSEDVEHEPHPGPSGLPLHGHGPVQDFYRRLFDEVTIDQITSVRRLHGDGFVVDESVVYITANGKPFGLDASAWRRAAVPILHVFEVADGLITRESGWLDYASLLHQLR